jgi:hypothetical protein
MGDGTFILLKAGLLRPKRANQAEDGLAVLPAILGISRLEERSAAAKAEGIPVANFYATWLIRKIDRLCYLDHSFNGKIGATCPRGRQGKDDTCIHIENYTTYYQQLSIYSCSYLVLIPKCKLKYFAPSRDDSIDSKSICLCREVTQAVDGCAMARPVICKPRPSKLYSC